MKAVDKESEGFGYLRQKFPKISEAKMKEGIFIGPQIEQLLKDQDFTTKLNSTERRVWKAFESMQKLSRQWKVENCSETVQELISSYIAMVCSMSLKLHILHPYLDFFLKTWEPSPMNMVKGSIKIFPKLKRGMVEHGVQKCWVTTAGVL